MPFFFRSAYDKKALVLLDDEKPASETGDDVERSWLVAMFLGTYVPSDSCVAPAVPSVMVELSPMIAKAGLGMPLNASGLLRYTWMACAICCLVNGIEKPLCFLPCCVLVRIHDRRLAIPFKELLTACVIFPKYTYAWPMVCFCVGVSDAN